MAGQLLIVNPSRRRRRRASTGRKANGQFLKNPAKRPRRRAKARRTTYRRNPAPMRANPVRRRRRRSSVAVRRYRRNPTGFRGGKGSFALSSFAMPAAMVGAGAVGTEILMAYIPGLPASLTTGPQRYATKAAIGVLAGWILAKYVNKRAGEFFAAGAIAIGTHDAIKAGLNTYMPSVKFGGANWNGYGYNPGGSLNTFRSPGIGYYSPGATLRATNMSEYLPGGGMGQYMNRAGMGEFDNGLAAFPESG